MDSSRANLLLAFSICDIQEKFRPAIHEFSSVILTSQKLLRAASILSIPVLATTQQRAKLGGTCEELGIGTTYKPVADVDKTAFSMWTPDFVSAMRQLQKKVPDPGARTHTGQTRLDIIIVGIETHICVLQTTLYALAEGHRVYVVQDGVSSCNPEERRVALERMRQEGGRVTTSESLIYEVLGDSKDSE